MNILQAFIIGIIEGITEFLPISSTAHITLTGELLNIAPDDFFKSFMVIIQLGALLPVLFYYLYKYRLNFAVHSRIFTAFIPTAIIGFLLYKIIKNILLGNIAITLWALLIGGIAIILLEKYLNISQEEKKISDISYKQSFLIGLAQSLSVIPGVSRSGATILAGLGMGIPRTTIIEFSFLLAVPTMIAASSYDILKHYKTFTFDNLNLLFVGLITSMFFGAGSLLFLKKYVKKHTFIIFGVYRIALSIFIFIILSF